MKKKLLITLLPLVMSLGACGNSQQPKPYFKSWNDCDSLTTLKSFVKDVTNPNSKNFIPVEDRIATFDMDGTFIGELYPTYFEYNMLEYRVLDDASYKDKAPEFVKEVAQEIRDFVRNGTKLPDHFDMRHAYAAAEAYSGMTLDEFDKYVKNYAKKTPFGFTGMTYATSFYKPMLEVFDYLNDNGFTYYVVSGSDRFICRALVDEMQLDSVTLHIPANRVIGMDVVLKSSEQGYIDGVEYTMSSDEVVERTNELIIKNLKNNKVKQIAQEIGKVPVLSFGNSSGDSAMHNYCKSNKQYKSEVFMLIADDEEEDHVNLEETAKRKDAWEKANYNIISMKDDFKTIYGEGVQKVDFVYEDAPVKEKSYEEFHIAASEAPAHNYTKAYIVGSLKSENVPDDKNVEPETNLNKEIYLEANFDSESKEWVINSVDIVEQAYSVFLNRTAKDYEEKEYVADDKVYQKRDLHYYVGDGYRYRYNASGEMDVGTLKYSQTSAGVRRFNTNGLLTYFESNTSVAIGGYATTAKSTETFVVVYK